MPDKIKLSVTLPADAKTIYNAWLDREAHSSFSKGKADIQKKINSKFTAGDGFIEGEIVKMVLGKQIVLNWRTTEFPEGTEDSLVTVNFEKLPNGTKVIIVHENLPEGEGKKYRKEWKDNYFTPMKAYFV